RTFSGTPTNADVGTVTVTVTATDGSGATASDSFDIVVGNVNDAPTLSSPIADQSATEDSGFSFQLPAGTFADADAGDSLSYSTSALPSWLQFDAVTRTFSGTPANADVGTVTVTVTATDGTGATASDSFDIVVGNVNDAPTGAPRIIGTPTEDQTLGIDTSAIADADGLGNFSYQWQRNGSTISGATGATYTLGDADVGQQISVTVSWSDGQGTAEGLTSAAVGPIANVNDLPSGLVAIDDTTPTQGQTLNASHNIADAEGLGIVAWQWQRDGVDIAGATGSRYVTTQDDVGAVLRVVARYTDGQGAVETVASQPTAVVANVNDAPQPRDGVVAVVEDVARVLRPDDFAFDDADGDALAAVRVEALPEIGQLTLAGESLLVGQVIGASELAHGQLVYVAPENAHGEALAVLWVQVADASGAWSARPQALVFDVAAVNDAPQWVRVQLTVDVGRPLVLGPAQLLAADVDSPASDIVFQVSELRQGRFEYLAAPGVAITQFTQADVDAARVRFVVTGSGGAPGFVLGLGDVAGGSAAQISVRVLLDGSAVAGVGLPGTGDAMPDRGEGDAGSEASAPLPAPAVADVAADELGRKANGGAGDRDRDPAESLQAAVLREVGAALGGEESRSAAAARLPVQAAPGSDAAAVQRATVEALARERADAARLAQLEELFAAGWELDLEPAAGERPSETLELAEPSRSGRSAAPGGESAVEEAEGEALQLSSDGVQAVGAMLTAGSVWWALRAGGLITSLLGALPTWRHVDLLAVLPDDDGTEAWDRDADEEAQRDEAAFERLLTPESSESAGVAPVLSPR
ncbi:MAG: putative Ig domain-containing protein, partial [Burkholderiaceae bacterium]|nr:putative Ig domain-containing protein [Burkholderiaceae bacterium]